MEGIWTIGHSSQSIESFLQLLVSQAIESVADVRRYPGSRLHPQFNQDSLAVSLGSVGISYHHFPELGGRRTTTAASANTIWRNAAFRGYADHMETEDFAAGLARLVALAGRSRTAIMCSEAVWWRCHRSLVADALKAAGARVLHIMSGEKVVEHPYTSAARIVDGKLLYGPGDV